MINQRRYDEKISSRKTMTFFLALTLLCLVLSIWHLSETGLDILTMIFLLLFVFFLFYTVNYHTLVIQLIPAIVKLRFGLFTWTIAIENIERADLDDISLKRIGGAGIHFSSFQGRYRAMFNFLEYPRVIVRLKNKRGPVEDVAFSTQRPKEVLQFIQDATSTKRLA